jgi:enoyl-CoA hydratase
MALIEAVQDGPVRILTLNRPEKRNALSIDLLSELDTALTSAVDDTGTSAIVLKGSGKGFSAGTELGLRGAVPLWEDRERLRRSYACFQKLFACPLPTIASVHGFAIAGGADLALHCDFLIAAEDALLGHPAVRSLGVPPTAMWLYRLGPQLAKRLLLTGDRISGAEAARIGLALHSCPADVLEETVLAFAQRVAQVGRECLIGNKNVINAGLDLMGRASLNRIAETEDAQCHVTDTALAFRYSAMNDGVREAARRRDTPFEPEPVRISGPLSS